MSKEIHILTGNKRKWLLSAPMMHNCEIIIIINYISKWLDVQVFSDKDDKP